MRRFFRSTRVSTTPAVLLPGLISIISIAVAPNSCGLDAPGFRRASTLPDLSGMVWAGDRFIAVHDAKVADEPERPRVSQLFVPQDLDGPHWKSQPVEWNGHKSNDLESAAWIAGTNQLLLVESGDSGAGSRWIFVASLTGNSVQIDTAIQWPVPVCNVEATAVASLGGRYVFVYAERNTPDEDCGSADYSATTIRWALFDPVRLEFGEFESLKFSNPDGQANRPIVGLDIDANGVIYSVAAFDPETAGLPNPDNGPFSSSVWRIGQVSLVAESPMLTLDHPTLLAHLDGFKVESVALRSDPNDSDDFQVFVGTDDENYGGTLRPLPSVELSPACP